VPLWKGTVLDERGEDVKTKAPAKGAPLAK
jgi:hypothetical protein